MISLELFLQIYACAIAVFIGVVLFRKIRQKGSLIVEILKPSLFYQKKRVKADGEKLKISKKWTANLTPLGIFTEEKPFWKFWRLPFRKIYFGEKQSEPLKFKNPDGEVSELGLHWTSDEIRKFIRKEVLKARMEVKPMSNIMFYALIAIIVVNIFFTFMIANRIGVF